MPKEHIPLSYSFDKAITDSCRVEESSEIGFVIPKKKSFEEATADCNGISVDAFFNELDERIKRRFNG